MEYANVVATAFVTRAGRGPAVNSPIVQASALDTVHVLLPVAVFVTQDSLV